MESLGERGAGGMHPKSKQFSLFEKGGKGAGGKCSKMSGVPRLYSKSSRAVAPPIIGGYGRVVGGTLFAPEKYVIGT